MTLEDAIREKIDNWDRCSLRGLGLLQTAETADATYVEIGVKQGNPEFVSFYAVASTLAVIDETSGGDIHGTIHSGEKMFRWTLSAERRGFSPDTLRQHLLANMRTH